MTLPLTPKKSPMDKARETPVVEIIKIELTCRNLLVNWLKEINPRPTTIAESRGKTGTNHAYSYNFKLSMLVIVQFIYIVFIVT